MIQTFYTLIITVIIQSLMIYDISAQQYDEKSTLEYINGKLDGKCALFTEKKNLRVEYYSSGETVRIDYIFPESIDFEKGIYFAESEGAVIITCYEAAGKCIERDIIKRNSKILYDRTNLTASCEGDCNGLVEATKHLIKLYVLDDVERTQPFE